MCTHPVGLQPNNEWQNIYFLNFYTVTETKCAISFNPFQDYLNWERPPRNQPRPKIIIGTRTIYVSPPERKKQQ